MPGVADLPDMVFPANAAVVLDRRALVARFRHPERQREEQHFQERFRALMGRGFLLRRSRNSRQHAFRKERATASGTRPADGSGPVTVNARRGRRPTRSRPSSAGR